MESIKLSVYETEQLHNKGMLVKGEFLFAYDREEDIYYIARLRTATGIEVELNCDKKEDNYYA